MHSETKEWKTTFTFHTVRVNAPPNVQTGSGPDGNICTTNFEAGTLPEVQDIYPEMMYFSVIVIDFF